MASPRTFGRRVGSQPVVRLLARPPVRVEPVLSAPAPAVTAEEAEVRSLSVEDELEAWKAERRQTAGIRHFPLRPFYLVASASFGIASFVLPSSVSEWMNWLLYALAAASVFQWFASRSEKTNS